MKLQIPSSKLQRSTKHQDPKLLSALLGGWRLGLLWSLSTLRSAIRSSPRHHFSTTQIPRLSYFERATEDGDVGAWCFNGVLADNAR